MNKNIAMGIVATMLVGTISTSVRGQEPSYIINGIAIFKSVSKSRHVFYNSKFVLTPENTKLANDPIVMRRTGSRRNAQYPDKNVLDEQSSNFITNGQFEIFIPVKYFPLTTKKSGYVIARMPQSLNDDLGKSYFMKSQKGDPAEPNTNVVEKQRLYYRIREMVQNQSGKVEVIFENPPDHSSRGPRLVSTNVFFRTAFGRYVTYVGELKYNGPKR